uniref:receptor-like protein 7 n=1 Tax=Erigeron canadensis TaxID=72917 RepID=UPI001CB91121|nr:receptor-like protein 7 [Erigeron canadensis]
MNNLGYIVFLFMLCHPNFLGINIKLVSGQCIKDQSAILLQLRDTLTFNSSRSTKLVSWDSNTDCCIWNGVACNLQGQVTGLDLSNEMIYGGINDSSTLFKLEKLKRLNLAYNNFNFKSIPSRLSNFTSLVYLNLSNALFSGQIPREISEMTSLEVLDISSSFSFGDASLKLERPNLGVLVKNLQRLTDLYLDGVNISSQKSDWCQVLSSNLPNLKVVSLSNCYLLGPIDESLSKLRSLSILNLSGNNLSTHVPDFFANFTKLKVLNLHNCNLKGIFPKNVLKLPSLEFLDLSINNLNGSLPSFPKTGLLQTLVLSLTHFSGVIPESVGDLKMLSRLELDRCRFNGHIPQSIGNLTKLSKLDLSSNNFSGKIPSFKLCSNLNHIDLSLNSLSSSIPSDHFQGLHNLTFVDLKFNAFSGALPSSLFSLPQVQWIDLSNNNFNGPLVNLSDVSTFLLERLNLSQNRLEGEIPSALFSYQMLKVLVLSTNNLSGTILMESIKGLRNIATLDLSYNNMSIETRLEESNISPFPQFSSLQLASCNLQNFPNLRNQTRLSTLDLSDNKIGGEIPSWIWGGMLSYLNLSRNQLVSFEKPYAFPRNLRVLDLHSNQMSWVVPVPPPFVIYIDYSNNFFNSSISESIGSNLSVAMFFSISHNSLIGPLPQTICNARDLKVLDLSHNGLDGTIPRCLLELGGSLEILNLGSNNFNGPIVNSFTSNCSLKTLDLNGNSIEGKIPSSLVNCKMLEVLNLGNNKINDTYPCFLRNNINLSVLVLRSNNLHGVAHCSTPVSSSVWEHLQIFDIASNNFIGNVPTEWFSNWHAMINNEDRATSVEKPLGFHILPYTIDVYYDVTVMVNIKGLELTLVKIMTIFKSIDISNNHFSGKIPSTIGLLKSLYLLNVSNNGFTGSIPPSLGDLSQVESLDLSKNKLSGEIPFVLTKLQFLSVFNLSYNQLEGRIPTGSQFQTFTNDSYKGNMSLCGYPLTKSCNEATTQTPISMESHSGSFHVKDWISVEIGYVVGIVTFVSPLIFSRKMGRWYNRHVDRIFFKKLYQYYERKNHMRRAVRNHVQRL